MLVFILFEVRWVTFRIEIFKAACRAAATKRLIEAERAHDEAVDAEDEQC